MYTCDFETTLQIYLAEMFNYIFNVIYFSILNRTYCGKHNVSGYGVQETNAVDLREVTA